MPNLAILFAWRSSEPFSGTVPVDCCTILAVPMKTGCITEYPGPPENTRPALITTSDAYKAHKSMLAITSSKSNRVLPPESNMWWNVGLASRTENTSATESPSTAKTTTSKVAASSTTRRALLVTNMPSVYADPNSGMRLSAGHSTPYAGSTITSMSVNMPSVSCFQHEYMASSNVSEFSSGSIQSRRFGFKKYRLYSRAHPQHTVPFVW